MSPQTTKQARGKKELPMVLPRAFALLRLLAMHREGLNLSAVSNLLDVPKSSLSTTLRALSEKGYLQLSGSLYQLGPETFSLASIVLEGQTLHQVAHPVLEDVTSLSGETTLMATLDSDRRQMTYIDIVESRDPIKYAVPIGTRRPLYSTAGGQLFLSNFSEKELTEYWQDVELERISTKAVLLPSKIESRFARIRKTGVSVTHGEYSSQATGFACPIWNSQGALEAVLVIGAPSSRVENNLDRYSEILQHAAEKISRTLGYQPNSL